MKKKNYNEEIDLLEIVFLMWEHRWKIFLIITISLLMLLIYEMSRKPSQVEFKINTKLEPISNFEESKYASYNNYIRNLNLEKNNIIYVFEDRNEQDQKIISSKSLFEYNPINYSVFNKISRLYLLDLVIEKINDPSFELLDILENSDLNKMKDDKNKKQEKKSYSIKILKNVDNTSNLNEISYNIIINTNNLESGKKIISLLNKYVSKEVRSYLLSQFNNQVLDVNQFQNYIIEDLNFEISNNAGNKTRVLELEKVKNNILNDKKLIRLKNIFKNTPINNEEEFIASRMIVENQNQIKEKNNIIFKIVFVFLVSLIMSSLYVLILNSIKVHKYK